MFLHVAKVSCLLNRFCNALIELTREAQASRKCLGSIRCYLNLDTRGVVLRSVDTSCFMEGDDLNWYSNSEYELDTRCLQVTYIGGGIFPEEHSESSQSGALSSVSRPS